MLNIDLTYSSNDVNVATVDRFRNIYVISDRTAAITVTHKVSEVSSSIDVKVIGTLIW